MATKGFSVSHARDAHFVSGLRSFFECHANTAT